MTLAIKRDTEPENFDLTRKASVILNPGYMTDALKCAVQTAMNIRVINIQ